jgi:hypothetical protein
MPIKLSQPEAIAIMRSAKLEPLEPYLNTQSKWKCKCLKCSEIVFPMLTSIRRGQGGCKKCGYKQNKSKQLGDSVEAEKIMIQKGLKILEPFPGSNRPWRSICVKCGNETSPQLSRLKAGTGGCKYCAKRKVSQKDAIRTMLNSNLKPIEPFKNGRTHWKCECLICGKIVTPTHTDVRSGYGGCKYCAKSYVDPKEAISNALLVNLKPLEPYVKSGKPWKCQCLTCKKIVHPHYNSIRDGGGCKYCAKKFLDAEDAIKLMRLSGVEPISQYAGSNKPWKSKCLTCLKIIEPRLSDIKNGQSACAYCARKRVDPKDAEDFMLRNFLKPLEPFNKAMHPWKCQCLRCNKTVFPTYASIGQGQKGCVYCGGKKVDPDEAVQLFLKCDLQPLEPYEHSEKKWKSKCLKCQRVVSPTYHQVSQRYGGCKFCATYGLDFTKPAFFYLMVNEKLNSLKIGIGGEQARENRVDDHARQGWLLYKKLTLENAEDIYDLEQKTLKWLREDMSYPRHLSKEQMPQSGWTETVDADLISVPALWSKVEEIADELCIKIEPQK